MAMAKRLAEGRAGGRRAPWRREARDPRDRPNGTPKPRQRQEMTVPRFGGLVPSPSKKKKRHELRGIWPEALPLPAAELGHRVLETLGRLGALRWHTLGTDLKASNPIRSEQKKHTETWDRSAALTWAQPLSIGLQPVEEDGVLAHHLRSHIRPTETQGGSRKAPDTFGSRDSRGKKIVFRREFAKKKWPTGHGPKAFQRSMSLSLPCACQPPARPPACRES